MVDPLVVSSAWDASLVTAICTGMVGVIGALTAMSVAMNSIRKESVKSAEKITDQVAEVHALVNSGNSALLEKIASLTLRLARASGDEGDYIEATAAAKDVQRKAAVTEAATLKRDVEDAKAENKS